MHFCGHPDSTNGMENNMTIDPADLIHVNTRPALNVTTTASAAWGEYAYLGSPQAEKRSLTLRPRNLTVEIGDIVVRATSPSMLGTEVSINGMRLWVYWLRLLGDIQNVGAWTVEMGTYAEFTEQANWESNKGKSPAVPEVDRLPVTADTAEAFRAILDNAEITGPVEVADVTVRNRFASMTGSEVLINGVKVPVSLLRLEGDTREDKLWTITLDTYPETMRQAERIRAAVREAFTAKPSNGGKTSD